MPRSRAPATPEQAAKQDEDLAADELAIDEDEEPSADEEVDLATGDEDLGSAIHGSCSRSRLLQVSSSIRETREPSLDLERCHPDSVSHMSCVSYRDAQ